MASRNNARSKQFLPFLEKGYGILVLIVLQMVRLVIVLVSQTVFPLQLMQTDKHIIKIRRSDSVNIATYQKRQDTFSVIALTSLYLRLAKLKNFMELECIKLHIWL